MTTLPFPMPNDILDSRIVVASVTYIDDERGDVALVLLLEKQTPFFTVAFYAQTDFVPDKEDGGKEYEAGELDIIGAHENIVPAVADYEDNGGEY